MMSFFFPSKVCALTNLDLLTSRNITVFFLLLTLIQLTLCLDVSGQSLQEAYFLGGSQDDELTTMTSDEDGNVYLYGTFRGTVDFDPENSGGTLTSTNVGYDFYLAKYDQDRNLVYAKQIVLNTPADRLSYPEDLVVENGSVFISASFIGEITLEGETRTSTLQANGDPSRDVLLAKYNKDGSLDFAHAIGGTGTDYGYQLAITDQNKVILSGRFEESVDFDPRPNQEETLQASGNSSDLYLARFNTDGQPEATARLGGTNFEAARRMEVDSEGNIILLGEYRSSTVLDPTSEQGTFDHEGTRNYFLAKYDENFTFRFALPILLPDGDEAADIGGRAFLHIGPSDNIYITGRFINRLVFPSQTLNTTGEDDIFLAKFQPDGTPVFIKRYGGSTYEESRGLTVDESDNLYLIGNFRDALDLDANTTEDDLSSAGGYDGFLAKLDAQGEYVNVQAIAGGGDTFMKEIILSSPGATTLYAGGIFTEAITLGGSVDSQGSFDVFWAEYDLTVVEQNPVPVVETVTPLEIMPQGGNSLTIAGANFGNAVEAITVTLGEVDVPTENLAVNEAGTTINLTTPPLSPGQYTLRVTVADQSATFAQEITVPGDPDGDYLPPTISYSALKRLDVGTRNFALSAQITDPSGIEEVTLEFLKIRENPNTTAWKRIRAAQESNTNTYSAGLEGSDLDELGLQTRFIATDQAGNTDTSVVDYTYRNYPREQPLRLTGLSRATSAPTVADYNLLAIPLRDQSVRQAFAALGEYDQQQWRVWRLASGGEGEYQEFTKSWTGALTPGEGCMLIYTPEVDFRAAGAVVEANYEQPYTIILKPGFNLIGNPYNFALNWEQVLRSNQQNPAEFRLKTFDGTFTEDTRLEPLEGGLVVNPRETDVTVFLPVTRGGDNGGRISTSADQALLTDADWEVSLTLQGATTTRGGIGMRHDAQPGYDPYDDFTVPRLADYLELNSHHPEFFLSKFSKDIVPTAAEHVWELEVVTAQPGNTFTLSWEHPELRDGEQQLLLLDPNRLQPIDMRKVGQYTFTVRGTTHPLKILYGSPEALQRLILTDQVAVGIAYPNPAAEQVMIPMKLPQPAGAMLEIYDATGRRIWHQSHSLSAGYQTLRWQRQTLQGQAAPKGLYWYRLHLSGEEEEWSGKVLLQ